MGFREGMFLLRALLAVAGGARQRGGGDRTHGCHTYGVGTEALCFLFI